MRTITKIIFILLSIALFLLSFVLIISSIYGLFVGNPIFSILGFMLGGWFITLGRASWRVKNKITAKQKYLTSSSSGMPQSGAP